jgi:hypothetical protein
MQIPQPQTAGEKNQLLFMKWLARNYPAIYNAHLLAKDTDQQLSGFFDAIASGLKTVGSTISQVIQSAPEIIQQYGATKAQLDLIKVNLSRAQAGQPPLDASGKAIASVPGTLPTDAAGKLLPVSMGAAMPLLLIGGLGLLAFLFLRRRRR